LDAAAVADRFPLLSPCHSTLDFSGEQEHECSRHQSFLFEPEGGYCTDPVGANQDLLDAAKRDGVDVRFRAGLTDVRTRAGRVVGLNLADGSEIDVPTIVNAAGPWCNRVNAMAGIETKWSLRPTRVQVLLRAKTGGLQSALPMVADAIGGIYFRPESKGEQILVGSIRPEDEQERVDDPDAVRPGMDEHARLRLLHGLHHRIPSLSHQGRVTSVVGMYTMNEQDVHPVVGATDLLGFYVANGFSGHGFKLAPAIGSMIAQLLTGTRLEGDTDVSPAFLSIHRDSLAVREMSVLA
jgi:sarcosine oxidase subunit beta